MAIPSDSTVFAGYVVVFLLAGGVCLGALPRALGVEDRETRYGLVGLLVGSAGWSLSHAGLFVFPTVDLKLAAYTAGLVFGFSTVFSWLYFCSAYTGRDLHRRSSFRRAALALYLGVVAVKLTNPLHHGYYTYDLVRSGAVAVQIHQQTFHWVATGLAYALATVGLFMLFEQFEEAGYDTRPLVALTGLTALPAVFDVVGFTTPLLLDVIHAPLGVAAFALGVLFVYEERFLAVQLTGTVDEAFVLLDGDGRIRDFNDAALSLFPDLDGRRGDPPESVDGLATVSEQEGDVLDVAVDGDRRHYLVSPTDVSRGSADVGRVVMFADVTDIERQRRELERHNDQLEEFAAGIRHELRNSLQVIRSRVNAAGSALDGGSVTTARESLEAASDRTDRMSRTVSDLATLAQYGQTVGSRSTVPFRETVEAAWNRVDTEGMALSVEGDGTVVAEGARLQELFENAFEFARHSGASEVTVALEESGFTITEDGTRPDDEDLDKLFEYGHAVPNAEAGMALPNVETLAGVHDWTVAVDESYTDGVRLRIEDVRVEQTEPEAA